MNKITKQSHLGMECISPEDQGMLRLREITFCRLIAEEGESHSEAYRQAFEPNTTDSQVIATLAYKMTRRPRVANEIARIRRELAEKAIKDEVKVARALDGEWSRARIAVDLYTIATNTEEKVDTRLKAYKMWGEMVHVNAFASANNVIDVSKTPNGFGVTPAMSSQEAIDKLTDSLGKVLAARTVKGVIDVESTPQNGS